MDGMVALPVIVGRQGQHAQHAAHPAIGGAVAEEGAVAAVMLDDEQAHHETGRRHGEQKRQPIAHIQRQPHQHPQKYQGDRGHGELEKGTPGIWLAVTKQRTRQV